MLENLQQQLAQRQINIHFAEIKGFVMDTLVNTPLLKNWQGKILTQQNRQQIVLNQSA